MGMSNRIGRRIMTTICDCLVSDKDKNISQVTVTLHGNYSDPTRATNACKKKLGVKRLLVQGIETDVKYYSMPIDKFVTEADQVSETKEK